MTNAGIVSRGLAALVDMLVVVVTMGLLYLGLVLTTLIVNPTSFRFPAPNLVFSTAVTFAVSVLYLTLCWTLSGRTVGAVLLGVRVVGRRAEQLRLPVATLRAAGLNVAFQSYPCAHKITSPMLSDVDTWLINHCVMNL